MQSGMFTRPDAEYENCVAAPIDVRHFLSGADEVPEHSLGFSTVRVSHACQVRNGEHSHRVASANDASMSAILFRS